MAILLLLIGFQSFAQDEIKRNIYYGNQSYLEEDYENALDYFQSAVDRSPLNFKANYNLANTLHRMNKQDEAIECFEKIVNLAPSSYDRSKVYHNIGNAHMFKQDLDGAIEAYKEALRLNPTDAETRYNLAYAMNLKKQQQQQEQENQNQNQNQNQDQNSGENNQNMGENQNGDQENGNNNQDQNQDENEGDEQDKGDNQDEENEENQDQNNNSGNQDTEEKEDKEGEGQSYGSKLSKEQIQNILDAYYKREKELQKKLDKNKRVGYGSPKKKDW
jgi:hypothetical protein